MRWFALLLAVPAFGQIVVDSHLDTLQRVLIDGADLSKRVPDGHADFVRMKEGGLNVPYLALWAPTYFVGSEAVRRTLQLRDAAQRTFDAHPELVELALSAADVERITRAKKIAVVLTIEGGHQIADDLGVLRMYHRLGVRSMTLAHFRTNNWADSSTDQPRHNGLTDFGKEVVREMNRIGMIVDISHVSDKTFYDALAVTTKPVIASHSSCRAISDVPRNLTDDMIRALGKNGGVMGINVGEPFLKPEAADVLRRSVGRNLADPNLFGKALDEYAAAEYRTQYGKFQTSSATLEDVVKHIDHAVKLAGVDHVGIGTDFDGIPATPQGFEDVSKFPALRAALRKHGYSDEDTRKILGLNHLRVLRAVVGK